MRASGERDSEVVHPPVAVKRVQSVESWVARISEAEREVLDRLPRPFVLGASRFIPYKRLDLVIKAGEAVDLPVVLAGRGPEERRLREQAEQAKVPVHFVHDPSDRLLYALYEAASVFVFPAIEDFGIMPVEGSATGPPVVGGASGGVGGRGLCAPGAGGGCSNRGVGGPGLEGGTRFWGRASLPTPPEGKGARTPAGSPVLRAPRGILRFGAKTGALLRKRTPN
mgnify:CR=1 FL=1